MRVLSDTHWLPKRGNAASEYEDAFYPKSAVEGISRSYRYAVSDGASESMLSGPWAETLVKAFCRNEVAVTRTSVRAIVGRACLAHEAWLKEYLLRREQEGRPVQWYEEPGLEAGAFATLLGFSLPVTSKTAAGASGKWEAGGLGDSCLFQVRGDTLVTSFPLAKSSEFGQRPVLLSSNQAKNRVASGKIRVVSGTWRRGDRFYLMTDALSVWFFRECEHGHRPWRILDDIQLEPEPEVCSETEPDSVPECRPESRTESRPEPVPESVLEPAAELVRVPSVARSPFEQFVAQLRSEGLMRNDDVTLTRIRVM